MRGGRSLPHSGTRGCGHHPHGLAPEQAPSVRVLNRAGLTAQQSPAGRWARRGGGAWGGCPAGSGRPACAPGLQQEKRVIRGPFSGEGGSPECSGNRHPWRAPSLQTPAPGRLLALRTAPSAPAGLGRACRAGAAAARISCTCRRRRSGIAGRGARRAGASGPDETPHRPRPVPAEGLLGAGPGPLRDRGAPGPRRGARRSASLRVRLRGASCAGEGRSGRGRGRRGQGCALPGGPGHSVRLRLARTLVAAPSPPGRPRGLLCPCARPAAETAGCGDGGAGLAQGDFTPVSGDWSRR